MTEARAGATFATAFAACEAAGAPGVIPYLMAGWPSLADTVPMLCAAAAAGAMAVELGIPFSDPLADGPTVQAAGQEALANGVTPAWALERIAEARAAGLDIPVAVMTYVNPVLAAGPERFVARLAEVGGDGLIVPDLPSAEAAEMKVVCAAAGVALIPLVAPTTAGARLHAACDGAAGFVYCVSVAGTTGARRELAPQALDLLERVRAATDLPRALGFGVSRAEHVAALRGRAEAAVVGSALLDAVGRERTSPVGAVERFVRGLRSC